MCSAGKLPLEQLTQIRDGEIGPVRLQRGRIPVLIDGHDHLELAGPARFDAVESHLEDDRPFGLTPRCRHAESSMSGAGLRLSYSDRAVFSDAPDRLISRAAPGAAPFRKDRGSSHA